MYEYTYGDGIDFISGFNSNDTLQINDSTYSTMISGSDFLVLVGEEGIINLKNSANISIKIKDAYGYLTTYNINASNILKGTDSNDAITNTSKNSTVLGYADNDTIWNYVDNVFIHGGDDHDDIISHGDNVTIHGGNGAESIESDGDDGLIFGDAGNDTLILRQGKYNTLEGGANNDLISKIAKNRAETPEGKAQLDKAREIRWEKEKARPPEERGWIRKCRKNIFPVLEAELISRKIKFSTIADYFKITGETFARKMNGKVYIKVEEAEAIKNFLGLDMSIKELFIRDDGFGEEKTFSNRCADWNIYPALKAELDRKKITATELAKHLNLSRPTVSRKLQGKVGITPEQKAAIRDFLQVDTPLEELFKRNE